MRSGGIEPSLTLLVSVSDTGPNEGTLQGSSSSDFDFATRLMTTSLPQRHSLKFLSDSSTFLPSRRATGLQRSIGR